ncbi:LivK ABC-type branched-chain amino acid transport systems, periplasmic component [Burkholderiaceae bacterium]|jgi:branched-chain amino acid transport system substrate-binding protein
MKIASIATALMAACMALTTPTMAQESFKIGNLSPLSGPAAAFGIGINRGIELAAEDVGTFQVAGKPYKLEVVPYDTSLDPGKTVAALNRAVLNDNVKYGFILGAAVHGAVLPIIRQNGFFDIFMGAAGKEVTNAENPTVFRFMASSDQLYYTFTPEIYKKLNIKRVAFMGPNNDLGRSDVKVLKEIAARLKGQGVEFVGEELVELNAKDFQASLLRLLAKNPDVIDTNASPTGTVGLIAKQARELGYKGYFISSTAVLEAKALVNVAGKGADNIVAYRIWSAAPTKLYDQIAERHMAKYKEATLGTVWEAYAATRWVVEAVQKAGTFDTKKVAEQLANSTFQFHPYGPASWGGDKTYGAKRQIQTPLPASIIKDGVWTPLDVRMGTLE